MKHVLRAASCVALPLVTLAAIAAAAPAAVAALGAVADTSMQPPVHEVCGPVPAGIARCFAQVRTDVHGGYSVRGPAAANAAASALPAGYGPADLRSAYKLPAKGGAGQTVAIVDAGDDANAEADLAVYRKTYGLPPCTTKNGCFHKVNQSGAAGPLPADVYWGIEIALDLDMVSAACPSCHLLLVEADNATGDSLARSEDTAARLGATEISNSFGINENAGDMQYASSYSHPGVAITASSGDQGFRVPSLPAAFQSVIAVGGTSLKRAKNSRGWTESVWNSNSGATGSGCSAWVAKPSWQHDPNCSGRTIADVSAVADPRTGPAIYVTVDGGDGWLQVGGTSASAPYIAGVIGLAGHPGRFSNAANLYTHHNALYDVIGGSNAGFVDCGGDYLCTGVAGYDGPTGWGTPHGLGAF